MDSIGDFTLVKESPCEINGYGEPKTIVPKIWLRGDHFVYPSGSKSEIENLTSEKAPPPENVENSTWVRIPFSKILFSNGKYAFLINFPIFIYTVLSITILCLIFSSTQRSSWICKEEILRFTWWGDRYKFRYGWGWSFEVSSTETTIGVMYYLYENTFHIASTKLAWYWWCSFQKTSEAENIGIKL